MNVALDKLRSGYNPVKSRSDSADLPKLISSSEEAYVPAKRIEWQRTYRRRVLLTDTGVIVAALVSAQLIRFGTPATDSPETLSALIFFTAFSAAIGIVWLLALGFVQSRDPQLIGNGADEYRRVISATGWLFGGVAVTDLLVQAGVARGYLAIALPIGLIGLLAGRRYWRRNLARKRSAGHFLSDVIVIGNVTSIKRISGNFDNAADAGYRVIGACIPGYIGAPGATVDADGHTIEILGDETAIDDALRKTSATTVAVAAVEHLGYERMRELAWKLDKHRIDLVVAPGVADIAGPRLKIRPIDNLPLLHVDRPKYDGATRRSKTIFDFVLASIGLLVLSPLLAIAAVAIKVGDRGPIFYRQERVGLQGEKFRIWKLRTMVVDADSAIGSAREDADQQASVFYKSATDSRITKTGRLLRKLSIDELPQLFNVLSGDMSIVGPRPLVPGEGAAVANFVERRSLVKPGVTGLWQVSGRSDVAESERIRLDHYYVDNWSVVQDLVIIWRTAAAVLKSDGAY
ncbi:sugar transferase [Rhodococcus sp. IEGM 1330]|uniref:sugar transferase n=1 Tax=Rhodococcus sp. IEGM 1330 TaxID=3082225 RepID=UPI0029537150|nr:sugar transferase [Rhodococcus sp. IEGM 1330]MDV8023666.1 sugar transferase [Rhodococcus sp. IEGM 1330]